MAKVIRPYDPDWKRAFEAEAPVLKACFGESVVTLHHIGSTAVPGIMAKPIIDILAEAASLSGIDACAPAVINAGYEARGEYGVPGRRYFSKPARNASDLSFHVHVFLQGAPEALRHLCFRDYLLLRPDLAAEYSALKRAMSDASGVLAADYQQRKAGFVQRVQSLALAHFS